MSKYPIYAFATVTNGIWITYITQGFLSNASFKNCSRSVLQDARLNKVFKLLGFIFSRFSIFITSLRGSGLDFNIVTMYISLLPTCRWRLSAQKKPTTRAVSKRDDFQVIAGKIQSLQFFPMSESSCEVSHFDFDPVLTNYMYSKHYGAKMITM